MNSRQIIALCEYFGPQIDETHNLPDEIDWDDGTQSRSQMRSEAP
jgi:hypothetical protein